MKKLVDQHHRQFTNVVSLSISWEDYNTNANNVDNFGAIFHLFNYSKAEKYAPHTAIAAPDNTEHPRLSTSSSSSRILLKPGHLVEFCIAGYSGQPLSADKASQPTDSQIEDQSIYSSRGLQQHGSMSRSQPTQIGRGAARLFSARKTPSVYQIS